MPETTGHARIPNILIRDPRLSIQAKALYALLASYAGSTGSCYPSIERLARELDVTARSVHRYLAELTTVGAITIESRPGMPSRYHLEGEATYDTSVIPTPDTGVTPDTDVIPTPDTGVIGGMTPVSDEEVQGRRGKERGRDAREENSPPPHTPTPPAGEAPDAEATSTPEDTSAEEGVPPAEEIPDGWSEEHLPIIRAWREWKGSSEPMDQAMTTTIRLLLRPRGSGAGARCDGKLYSGYTPDEVADAIEELATSGHHSAKSLVKHIAGLMKPAGEHHGNAHRGAPGQTGTRPATDYQRRREYASTPFDPDDFDGLAESLRAIKYGDRNSPADH